MSAEYHFGDNYEVRGMYAIGKQVNSSGVIGQPDLREMLAAVQQLRERVPADDREVLDEAVRTIRADEDGTGRPPRRSVTSILGVATAIGEVGAPVVEAVRKLMAAFGM